MTVRLSPLEISFPQDFAVCKGDRLDHLAEKKLKIIYNIFNFFFLDGLGGHPPFAAALSAGSTRPTCGSPKTNASETRDPKTSDPETHDPKTSDPETRDPKTSDPKEAGVREARVQEARVQEARVQEARVQEARIQNAMPATCQSKMQRFSKQLSGKRPRHGSHFQSQPSPPRTPAAQTHATRRPATQKPATRRPATRRPATRRLATRRRPESERQESRRPESRKQESKRLEPKKQKSKRPSEGSRCQATTYSFAAAFSRTVLLQWAAE